MIEKISKKVKNEKGLTGQDLIIAIFILAMFLTFLLSVYSNIRKLSYEVRMNAKAADTTSKIAEKLKSLNYDDPLFSESQENISPEDLSKNYGVTGLNPDIYQVNISINKMKFNNQNIDFDLTKEIIIQVKYDLNGNFENSDATEIKFVKERELVRIEDEITLEAGYKPVVIKDANGKKLSNTLDNIYNEVSTGRLFEITTEDDENWKNYSYFDNFLCCVGTTNDEKGETIDGTTFVWVPRYSMINGKIAFLYKNTNHPVVPIYSKSNDGKEILTGYTVDRNTTLEPAGFIDGQVGVWASIINGGRNYNLYSNMINALGENKIYTGK